jgi:hypothetical protein
MSALDDLVVMDEQINRLQNDRKTAFKVHVKPIDDEIRRCGEKANVLWRAVLEQYGSGEAQDRLRAAKSKAELP